MVTSSPYPYLRVVVTIRDDRIGLLAYADTGFEGAISLPWSYAPRLAEPDATSRWQLADGSMIVAPEYLAEIQIEPFPPTLARAIIAGDECLVGRKVLDGFKVIFDHGQELTLEP